MFFELKDTFYRMRMISMTTNFENPKEYKIVNNNVFF